ncbi:hypothetical protein BG004_002371, partial [Podila humilis]
MADGRRYLRWQSDIYFGCLPHGRALTPEIARRMKVSWNSQIRSISRDSLPRDEIETTFLAMDYIGTC